MKCPTDIFELATANTFRKVQNVSNTSNGVSIGPRAPSNVDEFFDEPTNLTEISETTSNVCSDDGTIDDFTTDDENINLSSNAAEALIQFEYLRKIDVNDVVNEQARRIAAVEEKLTNIMKEDLESIKEEIIIRNKLKWKIAENSINDDDLTVTRKFAELRKRHQEAKPKQEKENVNENSQTEIEKKKIGEKVAKIYQIYDQYCNICERITEVMKHCKNSSKLLTEMTPDELNIRSSRTDFAAILANIKKGAIEENDVETCNQILQRVTLLLDTIKNKINFINEEEERKEKAEQTIPLEMKDSSVEQRDISASLTENEKEKSISGRYICEESVVEYTKLDENLKKITKKAGMFLKNPATKTLARELRMAAGTPVNTLSSVNANHMRDKFKKISELLLGNLPSLKNTNVSRDEYYPFLLENLSKRFINHIESLAPVKTADAFVPASVIVALWIEFPDLGPVLLAHFAKKCPYVIPAYWPHFKGQSERDFYISRGYQYKPDGLIEDQNKFLQRMTAIFTLYIAIIVTVPRRNQLHPYGLKHAWRWLASTLNLEPRPDITAALLHVFLEMAGWRMSQYYGAQFWKMMHLLNTEYFNKIENVTAADFRGPVSRLKGYIEKLLREGRFSEPKGILPPNYW